MTYAGSAYAASPYAGRAAAGTGSAYAQAVLALSPAAYYRLDDTDAILRDSTGQGHGGTYNASWVAGTPGLLVGDSDPAVTYAGGAWQTVVASGWHPVADLSGVALIKINSLGTGIRSILDRDNEGAARQYQFRINAAHKLELIIWTGASGPQTIAGATTLANDTTYHVAFTRSGTTVKLYVNGTQDGTGTVASGNLPTATYDMWIGSHNAGFAQKWYGVMDEVALFNGALTAPQVANLYAVAIGTGSGGSTSYLHPALAGTGTLAVHLTGAGIRTVAFAGTGALSVHLNGAGIRVVTFAGTSSLTVSVVGHSGMGSLIFAGTSGLAVTLAGHLADITSLTFVGAGNLAVTLRGHVDQIEPLLFAGSSGFLSVNLGGLIATWPYVLGGIGGSFTVDFSTAPDPAPIDYTPDGDGSLVLIAEDYEPSYIVVDEDGDEQANEAGDTLTVVWSAGQLMEILLTPDPHDPNALVDFTWSYAERASSVLVVFMEDTVVRETPGGLIITISNGRPNDTVTLSTIGPTGVADFQTIALDEFGSFEDLVVDLPALDPGDYYLRVESLISGSEDAGFSVVGQPLTYGDDPKPPDNPPVVDPAQHWRFFDLRDPDVTYTFPRNPKSWTNVYPPNDFTHGKTVAVDGNPLTWQAAARPWRMEFTGWLDTQEEYDDLVFWSQLRRRFWLIDHRNRAWLITIEQFDAQALIKPNLPWAHNYTVKTLVFMQGDME